MCLGEVGRVRDASQPDAMSVEVGARVIAVSGMLLDTAASDGDWVLVHCGFAIAALSEAEAREALLMREAAGTTRR